MAQYIHPDLPFTEAEVRRAVSLVLTRAEAREVAREMAQLGREVIEMAEAAEAAWLRGSTDPLEINPPSLHVGDELLALLACVSGPLAARVESYIQHRWRTMLESYTQGEMIRRGRSPTQTPPPDVVAIARRKVGYWKGAWTRRRRGIARKLGHSAA